MRVTLKAVNEKLSELGTKAEVAKGAGYFLIRGGEADDWIDRTVRVPTIGSLTVEQWLNEYKRLKTLNADMVKAAKHESPRGTKPRKQRQEAPNRGTPNEEAPIQAAPIREVPPRDSTPMEACSLKA